MPSALLRFDEAFEHDPAIAKWFQSHKGTLGDIAHHWFTIMRQCGDEVREVLHDGCPVACLGNVPFAYVNIFTAHMNIGFFQGASLPDPHRLLQGTGKRMRHIKLKPDSSIDDAAIHTLIHAAFADIKALVEHG